MSLASLRRELHAEADPKKAKLYLRFFKTGPGQYGEGDKFVGVVVPKLRAIARKHAELGFKDIRTLLSSRIHEERMIAVILLTKRYEKFPKERALIFKFYLSNRKGLNNWDIIDVSAPRIVGRQLLEAKSRGLLDRYAKSKSLWERRIAIVSTLALIVNNQLGDTFRIAELLLDDSQDLIHKATGWMLREAGKRDKKALERFLRRRAHIMPRTMLRYSIEKFSKKERAVWLAYRST